MIASAIISALGTAASAGLSIWNNKKAQEQQAAEDARSIAYADAMAAENPLTRSENRALDAQYNRWADKEMDKARSMDKVLGTNNYLAVQQNVAEGKADLLSGMSADSSRRSDVWKMQAEQARRQSAANQQAQAAARNQSYAALAANAAGLLGSALTSGNEDGAMTESQARRAVKKDRESGNPRGADGVKGYKLPNPNLGITTLGTRRNG